MAFPQTRLRRLRAGPAVRNLVRETRVTPADLVQPLFLGPGRGRRQPIPSLPGVFRLTVDRAVLDARELSRLGVSGVLLFGSGEPKDARGSRAFARDGLVQRAARAIKDAAPDLLVIADLCLCAYTDHGHCGLVRRSPSGPVIDNDATLEVLGRTAVSQASAGADWVAPSGMMDGGVAAVRRALDDAGRAETGVLAYAAKFASEFYGPFRDAAGSAPAFGDRRTHQMDPANSREALREIAADVSEGADMVMVKPALAYLDIVRRARDRFDVPVAAYNVSGEYALVKAAADRGWVEESRIVDEILLSIKRAGADVLVTYHARDAARRWGA